ncbi:DUF3472 domain-containing protein [Bacillus thuringiensis]|uniref:DUF3472 domain-containing protein n=1 Tax=Bacillus thuringiensis TaxID=1428 RepID=UPI00217575E1|nr:DUF3472 domain-containing protein [Bacillus thuringiensis]
MISQKTKQRFNKVIIITAAYSMFSMFGTSILHTKAATHSAAPAVYVSPQNIPASDIISIDWSPVQTPPYTYWAVHNWNAGGEAGGYAGFQQQSGFDENGKRTLHFALWDPISSKEAIKAEYLSPNSQAGPFGGEGTGMKVQTTYGWKDYNWYTMTMRSWQENGHTKFGQWMKDVTKNKWHQIAIMDFPVANVAFNHGLGMFQEDWADSGQNVREARLKNGYSRKLVDKQWSSWNNQSISGTHDNTYQYDGGSTSEYVWVKAGGNTQSTIGAGKIFTLNQPTQPEIGKLDFDIQSIYVQAPNNIEIELLLKKFETSSLVEEAYIQEKQILTPPEIQLPNLSVNPYDDPRFKNQGYLEAAPKGINASHAWSIKGGDGKGTTFVDMEYGWLLNHEDLVNKNIKLMSGQNISQHRAHGTSVLGIVSSEDNQIGNIGIAPKANVKVISQIRDNGIYNTADAILSAVHNLQAGDILLLEAQASYDGYGEKYLPVEVHPDIFDTIRVGADKGIIIIEAGANGSNDLDNFKDRNGKKILNRNSPDFKDSGAIMVGAGSSTVPHKRLWFSNYGSRLDVYGWGENVDTTSANPSQNTTNLYTSTFSGTSSASPIIAGAATSIQGIAKEHRGSPYTPVELRNILSNPNTGTKSQDPWNDRIGVLPDLKSILDNLGFNSDIPNSSSILEGNQFAWSLKGISDFEFAKINFNKSTEEMQVDLKAGVPHHYFNETYASIKVQNASGKVVYNKDIYGNKQQNAESQKVSVKVGDYIELTHLEGVHRATLSRRLY